MKKLINIDLVPNFEDDDFEIIRRLFANFPRSDKDFIDLLERSEKNVKQILFSYFPNSEIYFFNSARSALTFLLESIFTQNETRNSLRESSHRFAVNNKVRNGSHLSSYEFASILTQAFSCLVVPNAIKFAGLKPVYVDIDKSFNLDIEDLKRKINENVKAIIIQNTFGIPAKIKEILEIAKENNILVIENLTHSFGAKYQNTYLGNFGDFALLSFNRNKVLSSIIGGVLIVRNKKFSEKINENYEKLSELDLQEIRKILFTGRALYQGKKSYNLLKKVYLKFLRLKGFTLEMVSSIEKQGKEPKNYLTKFPKILFPLLENQLKKLEKLNEHRKKISQIYIEAGLKNFEINENSEPIFLRFPVFSEKRNEVLSRFKKENIYLGDWYNCVLAPCSELKNFDYQAGFCSFAEEVSKKILNLPTHIDVSENDAFKISELFQKWK